MPYLFSALMLANIALFGYFWFAPPAADKSVEVAKSQLQRPVVFINSSSELPPPIGEKD
ncbi:MAG: hypothetical protein Q4C68_00075 [Moraxella sp.]|nr:hypothetical protein [Moraxella sp.]